MREPDKQTEPLVSLHNAGLYRAGKWLVRGIDLHVMSREIVTLVGPNGSGKSTVSKLATGILTPDEGQIGRQRQLRIGYVPQSLEIDWTLPLSVERFMQLTGRLDSGVRLPALERTGVGHLAKADLRTLSGGEFQRVQLARAIARKPGLLVLDEAVQGVDLTGEVALYDLIGEIRDETGCGVLMVSHDLHLVMAQTDRVVCLNGHVCCEGSPVSVASSQAYQDLFGARACAALAVYSHHHDHTHLPDGRVQHADGTITDHCHPEDGHHHETGQ